MRYTVPCMLICDIGKVCLLLFHDFARLPPCNCFPVLIVQSLIGLSNMGSDNSTYPASNLTWQILNHANENNYAVGAYNW